MAKAIKEAFFDMGHTVKGKKVSETLSVSEAKQDALFFGYLKKIGGKFESRKRRLFILRDFRLYFFKSETDTVPRGYFIIGNDAKCFHVTHDKLPHAFCIFGLDAKSQNSKENEPKKPVKNRYISADTKEDAEAWVSILVKTIQKCPYTMQELASAVRNNNSNKSMVGSTPVILLKEKEQEGEGEGGTKSAWGEAPQEEGARHFGAVESIEILSSPSALMDRKRTVLQSPPVFSPSREDLFYEMPLRMSSSPLPAIPQSQQSYDPELIDCNQLLPKSPPQHQQREKDKDAVLSKPQSSPQPHSEKHQKFEELAKSLGLEDVSIEDQEQEEGLESEQIQ